MLECFLSNFWITNPFDINQIKPFKTLYSTLFIANNENMLYIPDKVNEFVYIPLIYFCFLQFYDLQASSKHWFCYILCYSVSFRIKNQDLRNYLAYSVTLISYVTDFFIFIHSISMYSIKIFT